MPTSQTSQTFQKCCFTSFDVEVEPVFDSRIRYLGYAKEVAPTTGKEHWQGFAYAHKPMKLTGWKKLFPGAHIEPMKGDFEQNTAYCSKAGQLITHGKPPRQGERTDLQELKHQLDAGKRPMEIADEVDGMFAVVARTERFADNYFEYKRGLSIKHDRSLPEVYIRWGPPGSGKTRWMDDTYGTGGWTRHPDNTCKWNDGCDCDVILFDDVKVNEIPSIARILVLTDRYPVRVKAHNKWIWWKPKIIVFTSNYPPTEWWPQEREISYRAFERRVTNIEHVV